MTVVEQVYYQGVGAPHARVGRHVCMLMGAGEIYERQQLQATQEWARVITGWVIAPLCIRIENVGNGKLEVGVGGLTFATLTHGDFIRISNPGSVQVRGTTAYKLTAYPNA